MFVIVTKDAQHIIHRNLYLRDVETKCHTPGSGNSYKQYLRAVATLLFYILRKLQAQLHIVQEPSPSPQC
jgi:hypothetical protein